MNTGMMNGLSGGSSATVFNIQRFCLHDGPGVRVTVFLKGCPLSCTWCHNPESQRPNKELLFDAGKCKACGLCAAVCPCDTMNSRALSGMSRPGQKGEPDRSTCTACGACVTVCPTGAREIAGREYTVAQLMVEIEKDRPFFEESGGGVTFSGGEPLLNIGFVEEAVRRCRERGISVAIDTCGAAPYAYFQRVLPYTNLFLYDLKMMNSADHKKYTGVGNETILGNLRRLAEDGARIYLRLLLIEGLNTDEQAIMDILEYLDGLTVDRVSLLQYHDMGKGKYPRIGREYGGQVFRPVREERLAQIAGAFERKGFRVRTGG